MDYEWDEDKNDSNISKHGFDFVEVWQILECDHFRASAKLVDGEIRLRATGFIEGLPATVIYTMRGDVVRVISLRRARRNEWREYQTLFE